MTQVKGPSTSRIRAIHFWPKREKVPVPADLRGEELVDFILEHISKRIPLRLPPTVHMVRSPEGEVDRLSVPGEGGRLFYFRELSEEEAARRWQNARQNARARWFTCMEKLGLDPKKLRQLWM